MTVHYAGIIKSLPVVLRGAIANGIVFDTNV